ncbi:Sm65 antigen [Burkholderia pseudomallei Pasteur 52237]|nr:Sm65 antigen [Burkholderia pseudomallei Pasteur 52237]
MQSPEQGSREIETSKPQNLKTSKPQNLKTSKPQSRKAEKPKSRKAEKPKSRKAEKPKSPAPPRHQRIETESAGRAARAGGSPDKHAARSRRVLGPPRPDAVFARGASAAAHAALW